MKGYLHKIGKVWYTTVDLPKLPGAKRRQKEIKLGALSKGDAQAKEREVLREIENHSVFEISNVTVERLLSSWLSIWLRPRRRNLSHLRPTKGPLQSFVIS